MKKRDAAIFLIGLNIVCFTLWRTSGEFPFFRDYVKTNATVIEASAREESFGDITAWCPDIAFRYSVNSQTFTSRHFGSKTECGEKRYAEHLVAQFPPGQAIEVWYDQASPQFALIRNEVSNSVKIAYIAVILAWVIGSVLFIWRLIAPDGTRSDARTH